MDKDKVFAGPVPQLYDHYLGPILFEPFAALMAGYLKPTDRDILETAAGTGVVTRAMHHAQPKSHITATDLNQAMLDVAAAKLSSDKVSFQQADAQALPFKDHSFDVVVCGFGIMFMPDKQKAYSEARRVLKPGGRIVMTAWDRIETTPIMAITESTLGQLYPENPPRFFSRTPCGYHDRAVIEQDLRTAGFSTVATEVCARSSQVAQAAEAATGLCQGTPMRGEIESRDPSGLMQATQAVTAALEQHFGTGPFKAELQAVLITAS